jgi:hypothetical protein
MCSSSGSGRGGFNPTLFCQPHRIVMPLLQVLFAALADAHVTLALPPSAPVPSAVIHASPPLLFDIPKPPPALKQDVLSALSLAAAGPDAAFFVADAASAWCCRFVPAPPALLSLQLQQPHAAPPLTPVTAVGLIEAEVTRHSIGVIVASSAAAATASISAEALSSLPPSLRSALLLVLPQLPYSLTGFLLKRFFCCRRREEELQHMLWMPSRGILQFVGRLCAQTSTRRTPSSPSERPE